MLESDLERIKQELETIKSQSDERGESMTDTRCQHVYMLQTRPGHESRFCISSRTRAYPYAYTLLNTCSPRTHTYAYTCTCSPLTRLKEAMKKIKKEIKEMDLRIGVSSAQLFHFDVHAHIPTHGHSPTDVAGTVNHSLLHIKLANTGEKKLMRADDDDDDDD